MTVPPSRLHILDALGMSPEDVRTLRSVLDAQIACEADVRRAPAYSSAALTMSGGSFPRRVPLPLTVQQAMVKAVDTGMKVVLTLNHGGETRRHVCRVDRLGTRGDATVFAVEPGLSHLYPWASEFAHVQTGGSRIELPLVTACSPAPTFAPDPEVPSAAEVQEEIDKVFVIAERLTVVPDEDDPPRFSVDSGYVSKAGDEVTLRATVGDRNVRVVVSGLDFGDSGASANRALPPFLRMLADDIVARGFGDGVRPAAEPSGRDIAKAMGGLLVLARSVAHDLVDIAEGSDPEDATFQSGSPMDRATQLLAELDRFEAETTAMYEPELAEPVVVTDTPLVLATGRELDAHGDRLEFPRPPATDHAYRSDLLAIESKES